MTLDERMEVLRPQVEAMFAKDSSGHDVSHLERTKNTAIYLAQKEGGDVLVCALGSYLHDIHRAMEIEVGRFVTPLESLGLVRKLLANLDLTSEQLEGICACVEHHENYNWNGANVDDINALIVQDADNLDAIGAIGVARAFSYGGAHGMALYDPAVPLVEKSDYSEFEGKDASTLHHFINKTLRLGRYMNTETGKQLAERKTAYMRGFLEEFLADWNAEF